MTIFKQKLLMQQNLPKEYVRYNYMNFVGKKSFLILTFSKIFVPQSRSKQFSLDQITTCLL